MGIIEEGRGLVQDFVTPGIRSIDARLSAVEKRIDNLFDSFECNMDRNHAQVMDALQRIENRLQRNILERLSRLESKLQNVA